MSTDLVVFNSKGNEMKTVNNVLNYLNNMFRLTLVVLGIMLSAVWNINGAPVINLSEMSVDFNPKLTSAVKSQADLTIALATSEEVKMSLSADKAQLTALVLELRKENQVEVARLKAEADRTLFTHSVDSGKKVLANARDTTVGVVKSVAEYTRSVFGR